VNPVIWKIALSFVVAGSWIAGTTMIGERLGSKRAGLITNLPSNILISMLFMALTTGPGYAAASTRGVPGGMLVDLIFILVFMLVVPRGLVAAILSALFVWLLSAILLLVVLPPLSLAVSVTAYVVVTVACFLIADRLLGIKVVPKKTVAFSWGHVAIRALFSGGIVAGAVTVAQFAPPYMTGVVATFPAVLSSTLVILTLSQGPDFVRATGKMLLISTSNILVFAAVVGWTFVGLGPWLGTLLAFFAALAYIAFLIPLTARIR
jgi:hypothetical protein